MTKICLHNGKVTTHTVGKGKNKIVYKVCGDCGEVLVL